jgi:glycosyltransferase A (GT-A) superfamily protein (DUF2064 family)
LGVARQLIAYTLRTVRKTGLPIYQPRQQIGSSFGERLANAVEDVFERGHQHLIIVGNDSPGLNLRLLQQANQALHEQAMVVGPARDGGSYLIGLSRQSYQRTSFVQLAWETNQLYADLLAYGSALGQSVDHLPTLSDIDSAEDLRRIWQQLPKWHGIRIWLNAHFQPTLKPTSVFISLQLHSQLSALAMRGPPGSPQQVSLG